MQQRLQPRHYRTGCVTNLTQNVPHLISLVNILNVVDNHKSLTKHYIEEARSWKGARVGTSWLIIYAMLCFPKKVFLSSNLVRNGSSFIIELFHCMVCSLLGLASVSAIIDTEIASDLREGDMMDEVYPEMVLWLVLVSTIMFGSWPTCPSPGWMTARMVGGWSMHCVAKLFLLVWRNCFYGGIAWLWTVKFIT